MKPYHVLPRWDYGREFFFLRWSFRSGLCYQDSGRGTLEGKKSRFPHISPLTRQMFTVLWGIPAFLLFLQQTTMRVRIFHVICFAERKHCGFSWLTQKNGSWEEKMTPLVMTLRYAKLQLCWRLRVDPKFGWKFREFFQRTTLTPNNCITQGVRDDMCEVPTGHLPRFQCGEGGLFRNLETAAAAAVGNDLFPAMSEQLQEIFYAGRFLFWTFFWLLNVQTM